MKQRYINTDVVLESKEDLSSIAAVFDSEADLIYAERFDSGLWHVSTEAAGSGIAGDPESTPERDINALLTILESLKPEQKALLSTCERFDLDIGWASSDQRPEGRIALLPETVSRVAAIGATLVVTVYPSSENDADEAAQS
jgi:hypothetical protein